MTILLIALAVGFAVSMGAHYTGACMGMPHALGAVTAWWALLIMAPLTFAGAALASHKVARTVGYGLVAVPLGVLAQVIVVGVAFGLTSLFNRLRVPTSTIQILVFAVIGVGLATHAGVLWSTVAALAVVWAAAPLAAVGLGAALTWLLDRAPSTKTVWLGLALVVVGAAASFTMGANDVANATGALVGTGTLSPLVAALVGGAGLAAGVLSWGKPLLRRVAFDIVTVDRSMATAAQLVQAAVVLTAVAFGLFTSMNQALVGAMTGAGLARGRHTVHTSTLLGILRGWLIGPGAALAASYLLALAVARIQ